MSITSKNGPALVAAAMFLWMGTMEIPAIQQDTPPPPSAPRSVTIPTPQETTLPNGLRVIAVEHSEMPLVSARLLLKSGGEVDPPGESGLMNMTAELLTKGTKTRTAPEIASAIESLGGTIDSGAAWDYVNVYVNVMSSKLEPALAILADVALNPSFSEEEIDRLRTQTLDEIKVAMHDPGDLAPMVAMRTVFGDAPYGHPLSGTSESLPRIRRDDIVKLQQRFSRPDNAILVIGGDVRPATAFALAQKLFGSWQKPAAPAPASTEAAPTGQPPRRVVVVDMPEAGQAAVGVVLRGIRRTDPEYFAGIVANSVLGGGYSARLNQEIRIKRGLSYGAGSRLESRREPGPFMASTQTKNESAPEVASLILDELKRLDTEPIPQDELTPRKAVLIGTFGRSLETVDGVVSQIASLALYGLKLDEINHYIPNVEAVTAPQVQQFARTRLNASSADVIIVGNAKLFLDDLRKRFDNIDVIPLDQLDLNKAGLRK